MIIYGEDGLTLWALKNSIRQIVDKTDDTPTSECVIFYRPSFGRKGGDNSCQFGEFDFIVLSRDRMYLGETKWEHSPIQGKNQVPDEKQASRHRVLAEYVRAWFACGQWDDTFQGYVRKRISPKPPAGAGTTTRRSLETFLGVVSQHYGSRPPRVVNVLLYVYEAGNSKAAALAKNMKMASGFVLRTATFDRDIALGESIRYSVDG